MTAIFYIFSALFGASVGSFLNVCIYRLPREGLSVSKPRRSFCPSCGAAIRWHDNIPILSWLLLGGRCRDCRAPISSRYILVEALTAALFMFVCWRFLVPGNESWVGYTVIVVLASALVVASFVDLELRIIPDEITIRGMMAAPFAAFLVPQLHERPGGTWLSRGLEVVGEWLSSFAPNLPDALRGRAALCIAAGAAAGLAFGGGVYGFALYQRILHRRKEGEAAPPLKDGHLAGVLAAAAVGMAVFNVLRPALLLDPRVQSFWAALAGMLTGSLLVYTVGVLASWVFRKPAMGFGDVKLMGLLGAFTGWVGIVESFFLACFLGSVIGIFILLKRKSRYIPFGPFLATGALVLILWPESVERLLHWYMRLLRG